MHLIISDFGPGHSPASGHPAPIWLSQAKPPAAAIPSPASAGAAESPAGQQPLDERAETVVGRVELHIWQDGKRRPFGTGDLVKRVRDGLREKRNGDEAFTKAMVEGHACVVEWRDGDVKAILVPLRSAAESWSGFEPAPRP